MTLAVVLKLLMVISIILMLFALSLRAKFSDLAYLFTHWRLGLGAFIAMFVIVPAVAIAMALAFDLDPVVKIALVTIALSPIPPILPGKQIKAGGRACYITGLLFGATIASIIVTPIGVAIAAGIFDVRASIGPRAIAVPLVISVLLPMALGLAVAPMLGESVAKVSAIASKIGGILLAVAVLGLLALILPSIIGLIGNGTLLALAAIAVVGLGAGYALGGPDPGDRATLALAASTRHPGVAMAIASRLFPEQALSPAAILLSLLLSTLICIPFMRVIAKHNRATITA